MSTPTRCIPQHMMMGTHVQFGQAHTYYDSREIEAMLQPGFGTTFVAASRMTNCASAIPSA